MYEAVLAAIRGATEEASAKGWQGYELQAHVFLAAFNAAIKGPEEEEQPPTPEPASASEPGPGPDLPSQGDEA